MTELYTCIECGEDLPREAFGGGKTRRLPRCNSSHGNGCHAAVQRRKRAEKAGKSLEEYDSVASNLTGVIAEMLDGRQRRKTLKGFTESQKQERKKMQDFVHNRVRMYPDWVREIKELELALEVLDKAGVATSSHLAYNTRTLSEFAEQFEVYRNEWGRSYKYDPTPERLKAWQDEHGDKPITFIHRRLWFLQDQIEFVDSHPELKLMAYQKERERLGGYITADNDWELEFFGGKRNRRRFYADFDEWRRWYAGDIKERDLKKRTECPTPDEFGIGSLCDSAERELEAQFAFEKDARGLTLSDPRSGGGNDLHHARMALYRSRNSDPYTQAKAEAAYNRAEREESDSIAAYEKMVQETALHLAHERFAQLAQEGITAPTWEQLDPQTYSPEAIQKAYEDYLHRIDNPVVVRSDSPTVEDLQRFRYKVLPAAKWETTLRMAELYGEDPKKAREWDDELLVERHENRKKGTSLGYRPDPFRYGDVHKRSW